MVSRTRLSGALTPPSNRDEEEHADRLAEGASTSSPDKLSARALKNEAAPSSKKVNRKAAADARGDKKTPPQKTYTALATNYASMTSSSHVVAAPQELLAALDDELQRLDGLSTTQERSGYCARYMEAEAIWGALEFDSAVLLRASWLTRQASGGAGSLLPKRGDAEVPLEAYISVRELREIYANSKSSSASTASRPPLLPVIAVAPYWRSAAHPDPEGMTLPTLAALMAPTLTQRLSSYGYSDYGVFHPWSCLWQPPRTFGQECAYKASLRSLPLWHCHQLLSCWLVSSSSIGGTDSSVRTLSYWDKGWTAAEAVRASLVATRRQLAGLPPDA